MKKYLLFVVFIFSGICFAQDAQDLSIEEQLKLLGADDFFVSDVKAQPDTNTAKTAQEGEISEQTDSLSIADNAQTQSDSVRVSSESGGRRQPMSSSSSMTPMGVGQGRPAATTDTVISNCRDIDGKEICDTAFVSVNAPPAEKISVFDTASIAQERSIDFSRNLSQYRSPQKAFLYSLLLPGFGQAYNKNYWRTGLYAAIEIGMITGAIYFRQDARKIREEAESFADLHFNKDTLENFYEKLTYYGYNTKFKSDDPKDELNFVNVGNLIFDGGIYEDIYDTTSGNLIKYAYQEYMGQFNDDFYSRIRDSYATQGWDDSYYRAYGNIDYFDIDFDIENPDFALYVTFNGKKGFGTSQKQRRFGSLIDESGKQGRRSSAFVVGIFANHIASAMDAFLSTIIHNRKLLRDEKGENPTKTEDILSRISINSDMYFDKSGELTSKVGFVWRF